MKRPEMLSVILRAVAEMDVKYPDGYGYEELAEHILFRMEEAGMKPPCLPSEFCQAIISVYYAGGEYNQWEEDAIKDEKVVEKMKSRREARERRKRGK